MLEEIVFLVFQHSKNEIEGKEFHKSYKAMEYRGK
jgi:hypothetical protein